MKWISRLYIVFVGIILSITTGYGLAAFYPDPKAFVNLEAKPYPVIPRSCTETPAQQSSPPCQKYFEDERKYQEEQNAKQEELQKKQEEQRNRSAAYTRTAVFFGITAGAFYAILGLLLLRSSKLVSNGLMLAGVLTAVLTRFLVSLASLGAGVTGSVGADSMAYVQFGVLLLLSVAVIFAGKTVLRDE